jgi:hypothetical protein
MKRQSAEMYVCWGKEKNQKREAWVDSWIPEGSPTRHKTFDRTDFLIVWGVRGVRVRVLSVSVLNSSEQSLRQSLDAINGLRDCICQLSITPRVMIRLSVFVRIITEILI